MTKEPSSSRSDGDLDRPIREVIYLDLNRITSYLSQIHDGLTDYLDTTGATSKQEGSLGTQVQLGRGAAPFGVTFGRKDTLALDATTLVERKQEHHAVLTVLENILSRKDVMGHIDSGKPFVKNIGQPLFIDYPFIAKRLRGFKSLRAALQAIADLDREDKRDANSLRKFKEEQAKERAETKKDSMITQLLWRHQKSGWSFLQRYNNYCPAC